MLDKKTSIELLIRDRRETEDKIKELKERLPENQNTIKKQIAKLENKINNLNTQISKLQQSSNKPSEGPYMPGA